MTYRRDPKLLRSYINLIDRYQYTSLGVTVPIFLLLLLDGFFAIGYIMTLSDWMIAVLMPFIAIVNLLLVVLMVAPYRLQKQIWLFYSLYGLLLSLVLIIFITEATTDLLPSQEFAMAYRVLMYGAFLVWNVVLWRWHLENFRNGWNLKLDPKPPRMIEQYNKAKAAVLIVCAIHAVIGWANGIFWFFFEFGFLILSSAALAYIGPNLHRYALILRYPELYYHHKKGDYPPDDYFTHPPGPGN